jgi:hypothetical protein
VSAVCRPPAVAANFICWRARASSEIFCMPTVSQLETTQGGRECGLASSLVRPMRGACRSRSSSADGQRIAFNAGSPTLSDIYLINSDGSGLNKITSDTRANFYPTWSPEGSRIGFATARSGSRELLTVNPETVSAGGSWEVYTVVVETGGTRSLTDGPGCLMASRRGSRPRVKRRLLVASRGNDEDGPDQISRTPAAR